MADFALWAAACEPAAWPAGRFEAAYCGNRDQTVVGMIEADPVAAAVRAVMATRIEWTGTASELLGALAEAAGERIAKTKSWPDTPRALSGRLRRAATFLRKIDIEIGFGRAGRARTRTIHITTVHSPPGPEQAGMQPSAPSAPSALSPNAISANSFADAPMRTVSKDADGSGRAVASTVRANLLKNDGGAAADGADANITHRSGHGQYKGTSWRGRL
jgi:hypothetical protein